MLLCFYELRNIEHRMSNVLGLLLQTAVPFVFFAMRYVTFI